MPAAPNIHPAEPGALPFRVPFQSFWAKESASTMAESPASNAAFRYRPDHEFCRAREFTSSPVQSSALKWTLGRPQYWYMLQVSPSSIPNRVGQRPFTSFVATSSTTIWIVNCLPKSCSADSVPNA